MARYAISDIHGCYKSFMALLEKIGFGKDDQLYLLGDLIDRGPASKMVIDEIIAMRENGNFVECLTGNHEWMFAEAIDETIPYVWDWHRFKRWIQNGGGTTMMNFGYKRIDDLKQIDAKYPAFLKSCKPFIELERCYLVHAGFNFKAEDMWKDFTSMYWIRNWYPDIDPEKINGKIIIHGHQPRHFETLETDIQKMEQPVIDIDCGCVWNIRTGHGRLCALDLDSYKVTFQEPLEVVSSE